MCYRLFGPAEQCQQRLLAFLRLPAVRIYLPQPERSIILMIGVLVLVKIGKNIIYIPRLSTKPARVVPKGQVRMPRLVLGRRDPRRKEQLLLIAQAVV